MVEVCLGGACVLGGYAESFYEGKPQGCQACPCPEQIAMQVSLPDQVWTCCNSINGPILLQGPTTYPCAPGM